MISESDVSYQNWEFFLRKFRKQTVKIYFQGGVLAKKISIFGSGFSLKDDSQKDGTIFSVLEIKEAEFDIPNSFMCKISNKEWKGKYMTRDNRNKDSSSFGYNSKGGELIKVNLVTPFDEIFSQGMKKFKVRFFVEGKDKTFGTYFGVYSDKRNVKWGHESRAEIVDIELIN